MNKIIFIITGFLLLAFMTVRLPAQTSPVSSLNSQNTSVMNDNINYLQNSFNGVMGLFQSYFTNGVLNIAHGGTGTTTGSVGIHGTNSYLVAGTYSWTPATSETIFISGIGGGGSGGTGGGGNGGTGSGGPGAGGGAGGSYLISYPYPVTSSTAYTIIVGSAGNPSSFDVVSISAGNNGSDGVSFTGGTGGISPIGVGTSGGAPYIPFLATTNGGNGANSTSGLNAGGPGGGGGSSPFGTGGTGGIGGVTGSGGGSGGTCTGFGSGGGGGGGGDSINTTPGSGSNGCPGALFIQY